MRVIYTRSFVKAFESYSRPEQEMIYRTAEETLRYVKTGQASYGLRIKRLHKRIYESRINISFRLAYFREKDLIKFFCLGNHDDIRRCLRSLSQYSL